MALTVKRVDYFSMMVSGKPGEAYALLETLSGLGINLVAFTAVPMGPMHTQLTVFPEDPQRLRNEANRDGIDLDGPHPALLAQGEDALGALAELHARLASARVEVYSSSGVASGNGGFGYIIYVRADDCDRAVAALAD